MVQTFKIVSRVGVHFEVRKRVRRKLIILHQNNMSLLYIAMYQQREKLVLS